MAEAPLLDWDEAAAYLGTTRRHLRNLQWRREIAFVKVGRLVRFKQDDLDTWIDENRTEATN